MAMATRSSEDIKKVESLNVQVNGGQVTLTGSVSGLSAFRAAQEAAEYTPGVVAVNNELTIR